MGIFSILLFLFITSGLFWPMEAITPTFRTIFSCTPLTLPLDSLRSLMTRGWSISNYNVFIGYIVSITYTFVISLINFLIFH
jgi:ABC-type polysaccharide/polyol phosphate export permease